MQYVGDKEAETNPEIKSGDVEALSSNLHLVLGRNAGLVSPDENTQRQVWLQNWKSSQEVHCHGLSAIRTQCPATREGMETGDGQRSD